MSAMAFYVFSTMNTAKQKLIKPYLSPENESSIFKNVPLDRLDEFKQIAEMMCGPIRVKYRGPRYDLTHATRLQKDARAAAIYPR